MLEHFIEISLISALLISISWLSTYEILNNVWNKLPSLNITPRLRVMLVGIPIFFAHIVGIWVYAIAYFIVENYTSLGRIVGAVRTYGVNYESFFDCLYFSAATYTSLGLGDLVPTHSMRMLVGAEVLNGLVMIGWTISFTFLTMEKFWQQPKRKANEHKNTD
jgi:hypothetical protein